jgi:hypothetical protein
MDKKSSFQKVTDFSCPKIYIMIRVFFPKRWFIFLTAYADSLNYKMATGSVTWFIIYILSLNVSFYIMYFFFFFFISILLL